MERPIERPDDQITEDSAMITNAVDTITEPRHRWYFVKEGFSPDLVRQAVTETRCRRDDLVVDVFAGGGTTPLEAVNQGCATVGFEVNPFLAFVSRCKLLQCRSKTLGKHAAEVLKGARDGEPSPLESFSTFSESTGADKWLFNTQVLRAFEGGWKSTQSIQGPPRNILRLCLISAAMDTCNAIKDGKCLRYRDGWRARNFGGSDFLERLDERIEVVKGDLERSPVSGSAEIRIADSRVLGTHSLNRKFRLCVTSPPYLNSFDYTDIYRPELFLGRFVRTATQLRELRARTLRSHVQTSWAMPLDADRGLLLEPRLARIREHSERLWNKRIPDMVAAYFEDVEKVMTALAPMAADDASLWMVVSTSAYTGIELPVDLIIADMGSRSGWSLKEVKVVANLRRVPVQQWDDLASAGNDGPYLRESVVIFGKHRSVKTSVTKSVAGK